MSSEAVSFEKLVRPGGGPIDAKDGNKGPGLTELESRNPVTRFISVYGSFVRNAFLGMLAYRLRYYTGIVTYLLFVSVNYFIWEAVYHGRPAGSSIHGFTLQEMITYISVAWIARSLYFSSVDEEINEIVRTGQISIYLLRPVRFHFLLLAQAFGESVFRLAFFTLPIGTVILLSFPVSPPASATALGLFLLANFTAFFVMAEVGFLVGLLAFSLKSIQGVMRVKYYLIQLFSGLLLPLTFFPEGFQRLLQWLPLKMITYVPLQLYLGKIHGTGALLVFAEQLLWCAILFAIGEWGWRNAVRKLTLQGG